MQTHHEDIDNTTGIGLALEAGDDDSLQLILGNRTKIRHAGIVRAGIMVPKKGLSEKELAIYHKMMAEGHGFPDIDRAMGGTPKTKDTKLFPQNVPFFHVREDDFKRPEDAAFIREKFSNAEGKVTSIPIWLPNGDLSLVAMHNFRAFDGNGVVRCVSFYDGNDLKFRYVTKDVKVPREADWKVLDSDDDKEASKACGYKVQFGGIFRFMVPGVKGAGEILCPTKSWNGLADSIAVLKRVRSVLGRFDGLFQGESFLNLVKATERIKDPEGKWVKQHIVTIELAVDMIELARHAEKVRERGPAAIAMFNGHRPPVAPLPPAEVVTYAEPEPEPVKSEPPPQEDVPPPVTGEVSERRAKIIGYLKAVAASLKLTEEQVKDFVSFNHDGLDFEDIDDDALAKTANKIKTSMKNPEMFKADLLAAIG